MKDNRRKEIYEQDQRTTIGLVLVQRLASTHLGVDLLDVLALGERALVGAQLLQPVCANQPSKQEWQGVDGGEDKGAKGEVCM